VVERSTLDEPPERLRLGCNLEGNDLGGFSLQPAALEVEMFSLSVLSLPIALLAPELEPNAAPECRHSGDEAADDRRN
jgi:hypothetical protein